MALTTEQKTILKAEIDADPTLSAFPNTPDAAFEVAAALNLPASPTYFVWRVAVPISEIMANGFDWLRVDNMSAGKARIWEFMVALGDINPSQPNVRAGVIAAFPAVADLAMRTAIFSHCQEPATRAEKLFATGAGTTTTDQGTGPAMRAFIGQITYEDVQAARSL